MLLATHAGLSVGPRLGPTAHLVQLCLWMCVVVICATYQDSLVASLAVSKQYWPFTDLLGLTRTQDYHFLLQSGTFREDLLRVSSLINVYSNHTHIGSAQD